MILDCYKKSTLRNRGLFPALGVLLAITGYAQPLSAPHLFDHVHVLAADSLEGRGTATPGEAKAARYIARQFSDIGLQPKGEFGEYLSPFPVLIHYAKSRFSGWVDQRRTSRNVVGFIDNEAEKTIVIGAHYDHLGRGYQPGSHGEGFTQGVVHNGADDNASGVAGVIELARYFSTKRIRNYNLLFVAFSAEELGLLGSKYFVDHPTVPMESIAMMFNLDMVGRLDDDKGVTIGGWGTSPAWAELLPPIARRNGLNYSIDLPGTGPSDHTSFYLKDKPVLFFFTGTHSDYHRPTDDAEKINVAGIEIIIRLIADLIVELDDAPVPAFREAGDPHALNREAASFKVTLGIMPDYAFSGQGLRIDGTSLGRPARRAGIRKGDIIVRMGNAPIGDIYDYMEQLGARKKGDTIEVEVLRGEEHVKMDVTF